MVHKVDAGAAIQAGVAVAVVYVRLAVGAGEARGTDALVGVNLVDTGTSVPTGAGRALVHLVVAVDTSVARNAVASVTSGSVLAAPSVLAWLIVTGLGGCLTVCSVPVLRALTKIARSSILQTKPSLIFRNLKVYS